jgi:hypothetical protein
MKGMYLFVMVVCLSMGTFVLASKAHSYSYNAWVGMTGADTIAVNPFLSGALTPDPMSYTDFEMMLEWGFSDKMDFFYNFTGNWGMIRYDFSGKDLAIVGVQAGADYLSLQYHLIYDELDMFAIEANVALTFPYGAMLDAMEIGAVIAPVLKLPFGVSVYLEINPVYTFGDDGGFGLELVPGLCFDIGDAQLSVGLPLGDILSENGISVSYGAWLWIPFNYAKGE